MSCRTFAVYITLELSFAPMIRRILALVLITLSLSSIADEPVNKLNLCSRTRQTIVNQVDLSIVKAVAAGDIERVRSALESGVSPNTTDAEGFSLLHTALTENQDAILDLLIQWKVDVNQPFMGLSPLSLARASTRAGVSRASDLLRLEKLTQAGAVLSDFDDALGTVIKFGFKSIPAGFIDSMTRGDMSRLELYVRATYDINAPLSAGISPLHVAATQGTPEAIRYLVKCGANVNARTKRGAPVLAFAKDRPEAKAVLVELGATERE